MVSLPSSEVTNLLSRAVVLGIITFLSLTFIPPTIKLNLGTKIIITLLVVATYSTLDMMSTFMVKGESQLCQTLC
jgi:hypothetical protein